jgi:hypothetical protein
MTHRVPLVSLLTVLLLVACSGPQPKEKGPSAAEKRAEEERARRASVAQYETFDVSAYPVRPPDRTGEVTHQVPRQLMQSRADEGARKTLEGYRIQVFSAQEQDVSQEFRERVRQWWEEVKGDAPDVFRDRPPIVIEYSQPYYRVRIGAFAEREEAETALDFVRKKYDGAFVAQSTVTVTPQ